MKNIKLGPVVFFFAIRIPLGSWEGRRWLGTRHLKDTQRQGLGRWVSIHHLYPRSLGAGPPSPQVLKKGGKLHTES